MPERPRHPARTSPRDLAAGLALLAVLPGVVAALVLARGRGPGAPSQQSRPERAAEELVMQPQYAGGVAPVAGQGKMADLIALLPRPDKKSPYRISTPPKQWTAEKMHEKINGEDIVYLEAGCLGLAAMTLANASGTETIDLYLFQMTTPAAAAKVFAEQAPPDDAAKSAEKPRSVKLGDKAYTSYGSCYLRAGQLYLKISVNAESKAAAEQAMALARKFAEGRGDPQ